MASEFDFINRIRRRAKKGGLAAGLGTGIGDDAAVIKQFAGRDTVITADLLVEDIDFRRDAITPQLLGHRALAVSLSDIAAMGARPRYAIISLGVPREIWDSPFVDELYEGIFALAENYRVKLIGGDVSRTPQHVVIDSMIIGECSRGRAVLRSGARPGDHIFVTGWLGGAAAGLRLMLDGARLPPPGAKRRQSPVTEQLLLRHLRPLPRVRWGATLGEERLATAMIDLSDGLSSDLAHLCGESGVGAFVEAARLPIDPLVARIFGRRALDPLLLALHGGEDFELLFTVRPRDLRRLPKRVAGVPVTYIGDVTNRRGRVLLAEGPRVSKLEPGGFEHFRSRS